MSIQNNTVNEPTSSEGFLLLDSSMNPLFLNPAAAQILTYPQKLKTQKELNNFLVGKVRSLLVRQSLSAEEQSFVATFQSGRRLYFCRAFQVNAVTEGGSQTSVAVLLERGSEGSPSVVDALETFRLTSREREVFQYLSQGLTSKEVAVEMGISANTVKAFLRLIMVKMGVSTRSGILGRAFTMPSGRYRFQRQNNPNSD